ncbi:MAG: YabD protein [Candidatus Curtissbacteria bacterium GW2011_GWA2_41_24]|nr:MAG: YabD protein [Candidatus Curtissbacteria bacterium GW2011_GWA2_41_24]
MPVEKMLVETDSPYLSPEPWRGKINEPKNVKIVAEFITILRSLSLDQIAQVTSENAERLFGFENL